MGENKTILVVEDEPHIIKLVTFILEKEGYKVIHSANGEEGVKAAASQPSDLIIMDVMMPKMDGFEAAQRIISNPKTANTPIVILTSKTQFEDKMKAVNMGIVDYITKPFDRNQLLSKVRQHLG